MGKYIILTDTGCDLSRTMIAELGLGIIELEVLIEGEKESSKNVGVKQFYSLLRSGKRATTSAVGIDRFITSIEPYVADGNDVIYIGFSSGLSGTFNAGFVAASELSERYPERKIYTVDTLAASMGQGLLVYLAAKMKAEGASIDEVRDFVEANKLNLCHWFTVDDLMFLKRGGRINAATAVMGTMLSIKPVLHVDNDGKLISMSKARGRKAALDALVAKLGETGTNISDQTVFISHGDCEADARYVRDKIKEKYSPKEVVIGYIGAVIGAHSGPGTLAVFYLGTHR